VQRQYPQLGRQARRLGDPVRDDAGRADDEAGPVEAALALLDENVGERLHGFAQPHIIREDAT
jgi:hypothetical protein